MTRLSGQLRQAKPAPIILTAHRNELQRQLEEQLSINTPRPTPLQARTYLAWALSLSFVLLACLVTARRFPTVPERPAVTVSDFQLSQPGSDSPLRNLRLLTALVPDRMIAPFPSAQLRGKASRELQNTTP